MQDPVFGEINQEDGGWHGEYQLDFGGAVCSVEILIRSEDEIAESQRDAFQCFIEKWPDLNEKLIEALIGYYNNEERFSYGPDSEEEMSAWWPEIETKEALLQTVKLESIVVDEDFMMEDGRYIYLLFSRSWGGEDLDDNGIGVCFVNEEITEIGYKDIAF